MIWLTVILLAVSVAVADPRTIDDIWTGLRDGLHLLTGWLR